MYIFLKTSLEYIYIYIFKRVWNIYIYIYMYILLKTSLEYIYIYIFKTSSHSRSFNFDPFYSVHKYIDPKWLA